MLGGAHVPRHPAAIVVLCRSPFPVLSCAPDIGRGRAYGEDLGGRHRGTSRRFGGQRGVGESAHRAGSVAHYNLGTTRAKTSARATGDFPSCCPCASCIGPAIVAPPPLLNHHSCIDFPLSIPVLLRHLPLAIASCTLLSVVFRVGPYSPPGHLARGQRNMQTFSGDRLARRIRWLSRERGRNSAFACWVVPPMWFREPRMRLSISSVAWAFSVNVCPGRRLGWTR